MSGHMATLVVFTDALDQIENDPAFGKKVVDAIKQVKEMGVTSFSPVGSGSAAFAAAVHDSNHEIVIRVGKNTAEVVPCAPSQLPSLH